MARRETDRENLLAEGVNLPQRGRLTGPDSRQWIIGWRNNLAMSVFVDQDPVFHFNTDGELRRVYLDGRRLAAEDRRLCELIRDPEVSRKLSLRRRVLTSSEAEQVQTIIEESLATIRGFWLSGAIRLQVIGLSSDEFRDQFLNWLVDHPGPYPIAKSPSVG